jgi:PilZ domain
MSTANAPVTERRRWTRLALAIPVFVRGIYGRDKDSLEFATLLEVSAGGALLALRKPHRRWARVYLEIPAGPFLANVKWPHAVRRLRARVVRTSYVNSWKLCGLQFARPLV